MTDLEALNSALSRFNDRWDVVMGELDELTSIPEAELDPNNEDRIVELNEELCRLTHWTQATNAAIRREETKHASD